MVVLFQDMFCLIDEDRGALQALPTVSYLLGQLPQLHNLGERSRGETKNSQKTALEEDQQGALGTGLINQLAKAALFRTRLTERLPQWLTLCSVP